MNYAEHTVRLRDAHAVLHTARMPRSLALPPPVDVATTVRSMPKVCLNCDLMLDGAYCSHCGQAAKTPARISIGAVLHELPHAILHLDHALPHTILALLLRPGHTIRDYLAGKRAKVYSPFTLLFLASGVLGLAILSLKMQNAAPVNVHADNDLGPKITAFVMKYQAWIRLAGLPLVAIGPTLVLRGRTGLRYGEQIVAAAMMTAGSAIVSILVVPFRWLLLKKGLTALSGGLEIFSTVYVLWTYAQLQDDGKRRDTIRRWLRSALAMTISAVVWAAAVSAIAVGAVLVAKKLHLI